MNSKENYNYPAFSHIYVERKILNHTRTNSILAKIPCAEKIVIDHYKDVFNRRGQNRRHQQKAPCLILAEKKGSLFYEGAPVCQNFGNENFYYTSCMMNCIFDCSYCYLKGMYPSGHLVIFVNLEDYFEQLEQLLQKKNIYLCVSYDADLLALERIAGYAGSWGKFASTHPNLKLEIRTKSADRDMWERYLRISNVIYAFTVSPQSVIRMCERKTPSATARLECAIEGLKQGFSVRLCFDPMIYLPTWKEDYRQLLKQLDEMLAREKLSMNLFADVSIGAFRISQEYLKKIRRVEEDSPAVQFPYVNKNGVYQYPDDILTKMESFMTNELLKRMDREKLYHD